MPLLLPVQLLLLLLLLLLVRALLLHLVLHLLLLQALLVVVGWLPERTPAERKDLGCPSGQGLWRTAAACNHGSARTQGMPVQVPVSVMSACVLYTVLATETGC